MHHPSTKGNTYPANYYLRDVQGNVLAIYESKRPINSDPQDNISLKETIIYGSSRLGQYRRRKPPTEGENYNKKTSLGQRVYEFSNHLGNVLVTLYDFKIPQTDGTYQSFVVSASDYYPFGMAMKERTHQNNEYRYGFNGKENDTDFGNEQLIQDYGFRFYNPTIAKFLSIDPLSDSYPWFTPYNFAGNSPIYFIDRDGKGQDDPPIYIVNAIKKYNEDFYNALRYSVNTSNKQFFLWATGKMDSDPDNAELQSRKFKGAIGEAVVLKRLKENSGLSKILYFNQNTRLGIPDVVEGELLQVDVTAYHYVGPVLGGTFTLHLTIDVHDFYGNTKVAFINGNDKSKQGNYRVNYEVKAFKSETSAKTLYDAFSHGIDQTIKRGKGKKRIGVLVTDRDAWLKVVNDPVYGALLRDRYKEMTKERNYLILMDGLSAEAERGMHGLKDKVAEAEAEHQEAQEKKKN